jgi:hypothetical protein
MTQWARAEMSRHDVSEVAECRSSHSAKTRRCKIRNWKSERRYVYMLRMNPMQSCTQNRFLHRACCIATTSTLFLFTFLFPVVDLRLGNKQHMVRKIGHKNLHIPVLHSSQLDECQQDGCLATDEPLLA